MVRVGQGRCFSTQIQIAYLSSSISKGKADKIRAGMRLPYFIISNQNSLVSIYYIVNSSSTPFTVLLFNVPDTTLSLSDKYPFSVISLDKIPENEKAVKNVGLRESFVIVIRPDNYIGYIAPTVKVNEIDNFIKKVYLIG